MELPERVRPGDLITADFMNRILARLDEIEQRLDELGSGGGDGGDGSVVITQLIPPATAQSPIQVGQELRIVGQNFGFSLGSHRVYFGSRQITTYKGGSGDTQLVVDVPTDLTLPPGGGPVSLTVSNGTTFATRDLQVIPLQQGLNGDVDVLWRDDASPNPSPNPIPDPVTSGQQTVTFAYRLRSRANLAAAFTITPSLSVAAWQPGLQVLNAASQVIADRRITLEPGQEVNFFVRATLTQTASSGPFMLNVVAASGPVVGGSTRFFPLGTPVEEGDDAIELAFTEAQVFNVGTGNPAPTQGGFDAATNTISVAPGHVLIMSFTTTLNEAAVYTVTVQAEAGLQNWTVTRLLPTSGTFDETGAETPASELTRFSVQPQANAGASGQVTLRIQRQGETRRQERTFTVSLQAA